MPSALSPQVEAATKNGGERQRVAIDRALGPSQHKNLRALQAFCRPVVQSDTTQNGAYTIERRDELARRVHDAIAAELPEDQQPSD